MRLDRDDEALAVYEAALELRTVAAAENRDDPDAARSYADALNDLAWLLARAPAAPSERASRAARLAREAVRLFPDDPAYWNTLGAAYCRLGDAPAVIHAIGRAAALGGGGDGLRSPASLHRLLATGRPSASPSCRRHRGRPNVSARAKQPRRALASCGSRVPIERSEFP